MTWKEKAVELCAQNPVPLWCERLLQSRVGQRIQRTMAYLQAHWFWTQIGMILLYRLALDIQYLAVMSPLYGYAGFTTNLSPDRYLCSWLAVIGFAPFLARLNARENPSSVLLTMINYLYFLPMTSYVGCKGTEWSFFAVAMMYWGFLLLLQRYIPVLSLGAGSMTAHNGVAMLLTLGACGVVMFVSGQYASFRLVLNLDNVYQIRAEAAAYDMPGILSYALSMMPIFLSILLLYWLSRKRYLLVAIIIVVYLFLFSIAANKSVFFFLFLLLSCYFICGRWVLRWLPGLLASGMMFFALERLLLGSYKLGSYFVRRMMYVPVQLSECCSAFFQENPSNLFRNGIMGRFSFNNLYTIRIDRLTGEFSGEPLSNANNGLVGDMVSNLPILLGLLLMPLILIICFRLMDLTANKLRLNILIPLSVWFASSFSNTSWSTALLTHGFFITCLLLYFFPKEEPLKKC